MTWGVPYVAGMSIVSLTSISAMIAAFLWGGIYWLYPFAIGGAFIMFLKSICENDDAGLDMFICEVKWRFIKLLSSNDSARHGNKLTIHTMRYGNEVTDGELKQYLKKYVG